MSTKSLICAGLMLACCGGALVVPHASAGEKSRVAPAVSPADELDVLDPQVDSEGKPKSQIVLGSDGRPQLEIAPTVIVHRHYYTGDRDFQGPYLTGGPVVIALRHPVTGEQQYVDLQLPPGAPRIYYRKTHITYVYRDQAITLKLGHAGPLGQIGKPAVSIHQTSGKSAGELAEFRAKLDRRALWKEEAGLNDCAFNKDQKTEKKSTTAQIVRTTGDVIKLPVTVLRDYTPLSGVLGAGN